MTDLEDGIYFSLPAAEYHRLPRLSASGIANMLIDPPTYWADSWMNPEREQDEEQTKAQILGAAYHVARLEPHRFHDCYVRAIDPGDYQDLITNGTGLSEALEARGQTKKKAGESVLDQALRLRASGYGGPILHLLQEDFELARNGRTALAPKIFDQLVVDMERIQDSGEIRHHLEDGYPEVSILWTDPASEVKMKCRIDYLKTREFTDFKSFENSMGKPIRQFLSDAFRYNRYYVQAVVYHMAIEAIKAQGRLTNVDPGDCNAENVAAFLDEIYSHEAPHECWYIFQEKGGIPNLLARRIRLFAGIHPSNVEPGTDPAPFRRTALFMKANFEIRRSIELWKFYREEYGEKPWPPLEPVGEIGDDDFPTFWLEN
jgi:hypothetical protein